jgi:hypothetical protein
VYAERAWHDFLLSELELAQNTKPGPYRDLPEKTRKEVEEHMKRMRGG